MSKPIIIVGPPTSKTSRKEAESKLIAHPAFPKKAEYELDEVEGRWIAAIVQSAPPAFLDGGGAGETPDGPPKPDEAPEGPPSDEIPEEESPDEDKPKDDEPKGEKGLEGAIKHLVEILTPIAEALGGGLGPDASPVPGDDGPPPPPPGAGPPDDGPNKIRHERSLKPGEAPPGTTPIGAPSFASVRADHPWKDILGKKKTFKLEEPISEDEKLSSINAELQSLAAETQGYKIEQLTEARSSDGQRIARALVVAK